MTESPPLPRIASAEQWRLASDELLKAEKEATRALDALAARRRRDADRDRRPRPRRSSGGGSSVSV